jgi:Double zinc ribbon
MKCPKCHKENPEGKKFYRECGSDFVLTCPKCASAVLPSDKFCDNCRHDLRTAPDKPTVHKISPTPTTADSERRQSKQKESQALVVAIGCFKPNHSNKLTTAYKNLKGEKR